jgi:hypothetical protein
MFPLIWLHGALEELADVYVAVTLPEQDRIAAAVEALNGRLRSNPLNEGESRDTGYRLTFIDLLAVRCTRPFGALFFPRRTPYGKGPSSS